MPWHRISMGVARSYSSAPVVGQPYANSNSPCQAFIHSNGQNSWKLFKCPRSIEQNATWISHPQTLHTKWNSIKQIKFVTFDIDRQRTRSQTFSDGVETGGKALGTSSGKKWISKHDPTNNGMPGISNLREKFSRIKNRVPRAKSATPWYQPVTHKL